MPDREALVSRLAARFDAPMREAFLAAASGAANAVDLTVLADAVARGALDRVAAAAMLDLMSATMRDRLIPLIGRAFAAGASAGADAVGTWSTFGLDLRAVEAIAWVREHGAELVVGVRDSVKQSIRELLIAAQALGRSPSQIARQIQQVIGLDPRRAAAVEQFRRSLYDSGVDAVSIARRVYLYYEAQLRARALVIARHESMLAVSMGQAELWRRAIDAGRLDPAKTVRVWKTADDERVCTQVCEPLDEIERSFGESFPGGFDGPPAHVQCRCALSLRFK